MIGVRAMDVKKMVAEAAVEFIEDGMIVGLGTGSTAYWAIQKIGERTSEGLKIKAVATSKASESLARELQIPLVDLSDIDHVDLTIDGADEVDPDGLRVGRLANPAFASGFFLKNT